MNTELINKLRGVKVKVLSVADLGLGDGHQTHIGLLKDSYDGWDQSLDCPATVFYLDRSFDCIALTDPITNPDGSVRSPKLRKGLPSELGAKEGALSIIRSLSKVGDGLAVARHGQRMLFLVIPSSHLDTDLTGGVRSQHLPKVPSDSADLKEPYSESKYEYAFKEGLSDAVFAVMEGESEQVLSRRLKRSAELRDAYVKKHGYACSACKIVLSDVYGLAAKSLIEVHHLRPLAERQGEADATTLEELVGLCPNCHRVAHRRTPVYSVQEIKEFLAVARKRKAD